jgi:NitT/TauT family transport system substrate-binding protein
MIGRRIFCALAALLLTVGVAAAKEGQPHVRIAIGGAGCLCYLPVMLAEQLGEYEKAGIDVEIFNFKGGAPALTAVLGGSADVVSGFYDHCIDIVPKGKPLQSIVVYGRLAAMALVVSPKSSGEVKSIKDLAGKKVGVTAPGSSTDFFLKFLLKKNGVAPDSVATVGVGTDFPSVAATEQGQVDATIMLDPAVTIMEQRHKDATILVDTRTVEGTKAVFGTEYPTSTLYAPTPWVASHEKESRGLAEAVIATLKWIHEHSAEEIAAKMPKELVGDDKALYIAALKATLPLYSQTGLMDPKGPVAVHAVLSQSLPEVAEAKIDLDKTYTNKFAEEADKKFGIKP